MNSLVELITWRKEAKISIPCGLFSCNSQLLLNPPRYQKLVNSRRSHVTSDINLSAILLTKRRFDGSRTIRRGQNTHSRPREVKWHPSACYLKILVCIKGMHLDADFIESIFSGISPLSRGSFLQWHPRQWAHMSQNISTHSPQWVSLDSPKGTSTTGLSPDAPSTSSFSFVFFQWESLGSLSQLH